MRESKEKLTSRDLQAMERRKQILETAKEQFAEKGYSATTTRALCREINMADGLIYHYFPQGKHEILMTIVDESLVDKAKEINKALSEINTDLPLQESLMAVMGIFLNNAIKDPRLIVILLREKNHLPEAYMEKLTKGLKGIAVKIVRLLQRAVQRGEIADLGYSMMLSQLWGSIIYYIVQGFVNNTVDIQDTAREEYFKSLIAYTLHTWRP
ncbi:MAG: TetR/AcrR family transcriptional regulator [Clostridia bacterium]|nr:TetR/AcrR family transcriptional regulator [Clostridia bacterium]